MSNRLPKPREAVIAEVGEHPVPPRDDLVNDFEARRRTLQEQLDALRADGPQDGTIRTGEQYRASQAIPEVQSELDGLNAVWNEMGGGAIDQAREASQALTDESTPAERNQVWLDARDAKQAFHDNFVSAHEAVMNGTAPAEQQGIAPAVPVESNNAGQTEAAVGEETPTSAEAPRDVATVDAEIAEIRRRISTSMSPDSEEGRQLRQDLSRLTSERDSMESAPQPEAIDYSSLRAGDRITVDSRGLTGEVTILDSRVNDATGRVEFTAQRVNANGQTEVVLLNQDEVTGVSAPEVNAVDSGQEQGSEQPEAIDYAAIKSGDIITVDSRGLTGEVTVIGTHINTRTGRVDYAAYRVNENGQREEITFNQDEVTGVVGGPEAPEGATEAGVDGASDQPDVTAEAGVDGNSDASETSEIAEGPAATESSTGTDETTAETAEAGVEQDLNSRFTNVLERARDEVMNGLYSERDAAFQRISDLRAQGLSPNSPEMQAAYAALAAKQREIDLSTERWDGIINHSAGTTEATTNTEGTGSVAPQEGAPIAPVETTPGTTDPGAPLTPEQRAQIDALAAGVRGGPEGTPGNPETGRPTPEVMLQVRDMARNEYARLTALERGGMWGRYLTGQTGVGRLLDKIPGFRRIREGLGGILDKVGSSRYAEGLEVAKNNYESILKQTLDLAASELGPNPTPEQLAQFRMQELAHLVSEDALLEGQIMQQRMANSRPTNKFANFWNRQKGIKGFIVKTGVLVGAGALAGLTGGAGALVLGAGAAGGAALGTGLGALFGGGMAKHARDRRANAATTKGGNTTWAQADALRDHTRKVTTIAGSSALDRYKSIIQGTEFSTNETIRENRGDVISSMGRAASVGGLVGGFIGGGGLNNLWPKQTNPNQPPQAPQQPPQQPTGPKGHDFNVERGHGLEKELREWGQANGKVIDSDTSHTVMDQLRKEFGDRIITGKTYHTGGDLRISNPGMTSWEPGVDVRAQQILESMGKW